MSFSKMTEEELREYCVKSIETENKYKTIIEKYEQQETKSKEQIKSLEDSIAELKQKNYDLFVKVTSPPPTEHQKEVPKDNINIDKIINGMLGEE